MSIGQQTFDELGQPLHLVDFVVVDLETTGGSPTDCGITEIGAVRCRGGAVESEFQTLVNPGVPIPPFIAALTGITTAAVAAAPTIDAVLPLFLDFARDAVLVAHNAPFDVGFLKAATAAQGLPWPEFQVIDTARLARVLLHRDEVPNHKLATLARHFRATTTPDHRALQDARATVDVLHGLLARAGDFGAHHVADLAILTSRVRPEQRRKRTLADGLPTGPGVYRFIAPDNRTLYVGKATSIRQRVRNYFTSSETRGRIVEMIRIATRVEAIECGSELEASVREVRMIAAEQPPYNRRSRNAERSVWLRLTDEPAPRLSIVPNLVEPPERITRHLGPFSSRRAAARAAELLQLTHPLRTCTARLSPKRLGPSCIRADLDTCLAPCREPGAYPAYAEIAEAARSSLADDPGVLVTATEQRLTELAGAERFEAAAALRDDLREFLRVVDQGRQLAMLGGCVELVAAEAQGRDWVIHVVRHGRLAATGRVTPDQHPSTVVAAVIETAEAVAPPQQALTSATVEESRLILNWLWRPGVRLVRLDGVLALPVSPVAVTLAQLSDVARAAARRDRRPASTPRNPIPLRTRLQASQPTCG